VLNIWITKTISFVRIREQDLQNYLLKKDYLNAILLAMSLDQPYRLLKLFDTVLNERPEGDTSITGSAAIDKILKDMNAEQVNKLLGYIRDWNTNAKRSRVAQTILNAILTLHSSEELVELSNAKEVSESESGWAAAQSRLLCRAVCLSIVY
jgi:U3 small nucleolar RNA-associated protein 13